MYEYSCKLVRVIDGDTVDVDIDLGFDTWIHNARIRLSGIDAHETRSRDLREKAFGEYAKSEVEKYLENSPNLFLISMEYNKGKYGRIIGDLRLDDGNLLTRVLLENKVVAPYSDATTTRVKWKKDVEDHLLREGKVTLED